MCVYVGAGIWLGIELDKPSGKNDGSVRGVKYFSCPPKHGVFAPPSRVQRYVHEFSYTLVHLKYRRYCRPQRLHILTSEYTAMSYH